MKKQISDNDVVKIRKKKKNFSLNILYFYKLSTTQAPAKEWDVKDVFVPQMPDEWEWDVGSVLLTLFWLKGWVKIT